MKTSRIRFGLAGFDCPALDLLLKGLGIIDRVLRWNISNVSGECFHSTCPEENLLDPNGHPKDQNLLATYTHVP